MSTDQTQDEKPTIAVIEAEIEQTREQLGATVDELSHRLDVKGRASDKAAEIKTQVHDKAVDVSHSVHSCAAGATGAAKSAAQRRDVQAAAGGAVILGLGAAVIARRRHR